MRELIFASAIVFGFVFLGSNKPSYTPLASAAAASSMGQGGVSVLAEGDVPRQVCKGRNCRLSVTVGANLASVKVRGKIRRRSRLFRRALFNRRVR